MNEFIDSFTRVKAYLIKAFGENSEREVLIAATEFGQHETPNGLLEIQKALDIDDNITVHISEVSTQHKRHNIDMVSVYEIKKKQDNAYDVFFKKKELDKHNAQKDVSFEQMMNLIKKDVVSRIGYVRLVKSVMNGNIE